jgi:menaquinone-dependent protoporphyrinogen oxidase
MSAHAPRVLVVVASRHGATAEIAVALARSIADSEAGRAAGLSAVTMPADQRPDPAAFDAALLGSAVYAGNWLEPAREYATRHADVLGTRPVWLFSSGPIGEPPFPPDEAYDVAPLRNVTGAKEHRTFPGRMDKDRLSFGERAMVTAMRAPIGDFRDWDAVRRWGGEIAGHIAGVGEPTAVGT